MNFKIDIYQLRHLGDHGSEIFYYGCLTGHTKKDFQYLIDLFHNGGKDTICIEGLGIRSFKLEEVMIIELTGYLVDGEYLKNLALNSAELQITNSYLEEPKFYADDDSDFIIIGDDLTSEKFSNINFDFLNRKDVILIEGQNIFEWGSSGFFEDYIVNVLSNVTSSLMDKLISIGMPTNSISKFRLPNKVKNRIAKEYNIKPNSLFLEEYKKEGSLEFISFRNIYLKINIILENDELISLQAENLNNYL